MVYPGITKSQFQLKKTNGAPINVRELSFVEIYFVKHCPNDTKEMQGFRPED